MDVALLVCNFINLFLVHMLKQYFHFNGLGFPFLNKFCSTTSVSMSCTCVLLSKNKNLSSKKSVKCPKPSSLRNNRAYENTLCFNFCTFLLMKSSISEEFQKYNTISF